MEPQLGQKQRIFISKRDGKTIIKKFSAFFNPEQLKFEKLGRKEEKVVEKLSFKPELIPSRKEVTIISKRLKELGYRRNNNMVLEFSFYLQAVPPKFRQKFAEESMPNLLEASQRKEELILALSLCLWKTRPCFREKFVDEIVPKLLEAAFSNFCEADAVKALSYLHKVKQYEPGEEITKLGRTGWRLIATEFSECCGRFMENLEIMQTSPDFNHREVWKLFKEALTGRMRDNDSVETNTDEGFSSRNSNRANASED